MQELSNLENELERIGRDMPQQSEKIMKSMSSELRKIAKKNTPEGDKKYYYYKGNKTAITNSKRMKNRWRSGKVKREGSTLVAEVKNKAPHAHLVEDGHTIVTRGGAVKGFVPGQHVLEISLEEFDEKLPEVMDDLVDNVLRKLK